MVAVVAQLLVDLPVGHEHFVGTTHSQVDQKFI